VICRCGGVGCALQISIICSIIICLCVDMYTCIVGIIFDGAGVIGFLTRGQAFPTQAASTTSTCCRNLLPCSFRLSLVSLSVASSIQSPVQ